MRGQSHPVNYRSSKSFNGLGRCQPRELHPHSLRGSQRDRTTCRRYFEQCHQACRRSGLGASVRHRSIEHAFSRRWFDQTVGEVGQHRRVVDAGQHGKAAKALEHLPGGGRLCWAGTRQPAPPAHPLQGAEQLPGLLFVTAHQGRRRPGGIPSTYRADPQQSFRLGLARQGCRRGSPSPIRRSQRRPKDVPRDRAQQARLRQLDQRGVDAADPEWYRANASVTSVISPCSP